MCDVAIQHIQFRDIVSLISRHCSPVVHAAAQKFTWSLPRRMLPPSIKTDLARFICVKMRHLHVKMRHLCVKMRHLRVKMRHLSVILRLDALLPDRRRISRGLTAPVLSHRAMRQVVLYQSPTRLSRNHHACRIFPQRIGLNFRHASGS